MYIAGLRYKTVTPFGHTDNKKLMVYVNYIKRAFQIVGCYTNCILNAIPYRIKFRPLTKLKMNLRGWYEAQITSHVVCDVSMIAVRLI